MPPKDHLSLCAARAILATIWLSFPTMALAQDPQPNKEAAEVVTKETAANENTGTAEPQDTESKSENPESPVQPLGSPTQFIYNEAKRDPILSRELQFIRGNATPIELVGELETVTGVWQEELSGKPIGGALILTPAEISPSSIEIQNLQYYLALNGWSSLTITTLPADATAPPPASAIVTPPPSPQDEDTQDSTEQDKQAENTDDEPEVDESEVVYQEPDEEKGSQQEGNQAPAASEPAASNPIPEEPAISNQEKMIERIELGFNALRDKNYFNNVLIAYERSPVNFAEFLSINERSESSITSLQAIVFVNAKTVNKDESMALDSTIELNLPTLDIINKTYIINTKAQTARRNRANQLKHPLYSTRQLQLGEINTGQENGLSRAIRGFITRHASGTETNQ